jgi:hypothetical protein
VSSSTSSVAEPSSPDLTLSISERASAFTTVFDARRLSRSASITSDAGYRVGPVSMTSAKNQRMNDRVDKYINDFPPYLSEVNRLASDLGRARGKSAEEDAILRDIPEMSSYSKEENRRSRSIAGLLSNSAPDEDFRRKRDSVVERRPSTKADRDVTESKSKRLSISGFLPTAKDKEIKSRRTSKAETIQQTPTDKDPAQSKSKRLSIASLLPISKDKEIKSRRTSKVEPIQNAPAEQEGSWKRRSKTFSNLVRRKSTVA